MGIGKIIGSMSPAYGLLSGNGLFGSEFFKKYMGTMSPAYGAASGNGAFGSLLQALLGAGR